MALVFSLKKTGSIIVGVAVAVPVLFLSYVLLDSLYFSKQPIILFGEYFGAPPSSETGNKLTELVRQVNETAEALKTESEVLKSQVIAFEDERNIPEGTFSGARHYYEESGVSYRLNRCDVNIDFITCHLVVINKEADKELGLSVRGTRLFSEQGDELESNSIGMGNESDDYSVSKLLLRNVPIKVFSRFQFKESRFDRAAALEFHFRDTRVVFRSVPLV